MYLGLILFSISISFGQMNWGFIEHHSPQVPVAVQQAKEKIFKITVPYYAKIDEKDYQKILDLKNVTPQMIEAIDKCHANKKSSCLVPFSKIQGTAFLDKSPDHIWTNCHIVSEWMKYAGEDQIFEKSSQVRSFFKTQNIPLHLADFTGNSVLSESDSAQIVSFSTVTNFPNVESGCNINDDMVKIKISRSLAKEGLAWEKNINPSSQQYLGGYPKETLSRLPIGKIDSDGKSFYWTTGKGFDDTDILDTDYLKQRPDISLVLSGPYIEMTFAEGVEGMSGSPVLTAEGKVIGIYKGYVPQSQEQKDLPFISLYFSTMGMRFLEILSE